VPPPRPPSALEKSFVTSSYAVFNRAQDIPASIRPLIPHPVANPGEDYNETDGIDLAKPMAQLIFGGIAQETAFVLYRTGSVAGPLDRLLIARLAGNEVSAYCVLLVGHVTTMSVKILQLEVSHGLQVLHGSDCQ